MSEVDFSDAYPVQNIQEEYAILRASSCSCGGRWIPGRQQLIYDEATRQHYDVLSPTCHECGAERTFVFDISAFASAEPASSNPYTAAFSGSCKRHAPLRSTTVTTL